MEAARETPTHRPNDDGSTTVDLCCYQQGQSVTFVENRRYPDGTARRVEIRRDSYNHQSYAQVSQWAPAGWVVVNRWPIVGTPVEDVHCYDKNPDLGPFLGVAEQLFANSRRLLGPAVANSNNQT